MPAAGTSGRRSRPGNVPAAGKVETCQRRAPAAGKVETCQRRAPAAGRSRRASAGHQRREGRDVPAAGTSGRKVETCQRRAPAAGRSRRASGRKVETCQRPEGRDVPAAGHQRPGRSRRASAGHQRPEGRDVPAAGRSRRASGREGRDVPAAGTSGRKVETCQRRAPAAGRSRRASGREGRDVPAAGTSGGKVETCQRPGTSGRECASGRKVETCQRCQRRSAPDVRRIIITLVTTQLVVLFLLPKICHKARKYGTFRRVPFYSLYPLQSARPQQRRIYRHRHHRPRIRYIRFSRVISPIPHGLHLRGGATSDCNVYASISVLAGGMDCVQSNARLGSAPEFRLRPHNRHNRHDPPEVSPPAYSIRSARPTHADRPDNRYNPHVPHARRSSSMRDYAGYTGNAASGCMLLSGYA